jgi:hypothetical protein
VASLPLEGAGSRAQCSESDPDFPGSTEQVPAQQGHLRGGPFDPATFPRAWKDEVTSSRFWEFESREVRDTDR